jgi:hypothetical protein
LAMWDLHNLSIPRTASGPPAMVVAGMLLLFVLPNQALAVLAAWTLVSFPIGILIGHCVLNEEAQ